MAMLSEQFPGFPDPAQTALTGANIDDPDTAAAYRDEFLRFLRSLHEDDVSPVLEALIYHPVINLKKSTKDQFMLVLSQITSKEYVLNNYPQHSDKYLRELAFNMLTIELEISTPEVDSLSPWYFIIIGVLEEHFANRLYRSREGYEREMMATQRSVDVSKQLTEDSDPRPGVGRLNNFVNRFQ